MGEQREGLTGAEMGPPDKAPTIDSGGLSQPLQTRPSVDDPIASNTYPGEQLPETD